MGKLFDLDSPLIRFLNRLADLMWLNILTILCCIPIITAGAALTAAHYVALKMRRNEEGYIAREFFKSFKMNFKQSTLIWLLLLLVTAILGMDYYIIKEAIIELPDAMQVVLMAIAILFVFLVVWVFPVQAKFVNTIPKTIKNAFALSIIQLPKTVLMVVLYVLPYGLCWLSMRLFPIAFLFGISLPVFGSAFLYDKMFQKLEDKIKERLDGDKTAEEEGEDTEKIFSDEPMIEETKEK